MRDFKEGHVELVDGLVHHGVVVDEVFLQVRGDQWAADRHEDVLRLRRGVLFGRNSEMTFDIHDLKKTKL